MGKDTDVARVTAVLRTPAIRYHSFGNQPVRAKKFMHGEVAENGAENASSEPRDEVSSLLGDSPSAVPDVPAMAPQASRKPVAEPGKLQSGVEHPANGPVPGPFPGAGGPALQEMLGAAFAPPAPAMPAAPLQGLFRAPPPPEAPVPPVQAAAALPPEPGFPPASIPSPVKPGFVAPFRSPEGRGGAFAASSPPFAKGAASAAPVSPAVPLGGAASLLARLQAAREGGGSPAATLLEQLRATPAMPAAPPRPVAGPARPPLLAALSHPQPGPAAAGAPERLDLSRLFRAGRAAPAAPDEVPEVLRALRLFRHG